VEERELLSDVELITLVGQGNVPAFQELYKRYARLVYNLARKITGRNQEAEDITQEVFVKVWSTAKMFDVQKTSKLAPWLLKICQNMAIDKARSNQRNIKAVDQMSHLIKEYDLESELQKALLKDRLRKVMEKLPQDQREVIKLVYIMDMKQIDVAEKLGISVNTVKSRLRLGLSKLKKELIEEVVTYE
jgi:RNA polymerase sigma-70 factor, ECF subfamily